MRFVHHYFRLFIIINNIYILLIVFLPLDLWNLSHQKKEFRKYWPRGFELQGDKEEDEWWRARLFIYGFNEALSNIASSYLKVRDESMSAIKFFTMLKGNLPHLSYLFLRPEPLGAKFKTFACFVTVSVTGMWRGSLGASFRIGRLESDGVLVVWYCRYTV